MYVQTGNRSLFVKKIVAADKEILQRCSDVKSGFVASFGSIRIEADVPEQVKSMQEHGFRVAILPASKGVNITVNGADQRKPRYNGEHVCPGQMKFCNAKTCSDKRKCQCDRRYTTWYGVGQQPDECDKTGCKSKLCPCYNSDGARAGGLGIQEDRPKQCPTLDQSRGSWDCGGIHKMPLNGGPVVVNCFTNGAVRKGRFVAIWTGNTSSPQSVVVDTIRIAEKGAAFSGKFCDTYDPGNAGGASAKFGTIQHAFLKGFHQGSTGTKAAFVKGFHQGQASASGSSGEQASNLSANTSQALPGILLGAAHESEKKQRQVELGESNGAKPGYLFGKKYAASASSNVFRTCPSAACPTNLGPQTGSVAAARHGVETHWECAVTKAIHNCRSIVDIAPADLNALVDGVCGMKAFGQEPREIQGCTRGLRQGESCKSDDDCPVVGADNTKGNAGLCKKIKMVPGCVAASMVACSKKTGYDKLAAMGM